MEDYDKDNINQENREIANNAKKGDDSTEQKEIDVSVEIEKPDTVNFETINPGIDKIIESETTDRLRKGNKKYKTTGCIFLVLIIVTIGTFFIMNRFGHNGEIHPPLSSDELSGLNYKEVVKEFEDAGFSNVKTMKKEDLVIGWLASDGEVEKVTINNEEKFSGKAWYKPADKVVVFYHTYPPESEEEGKEEKNNIESNAEITHIDKSNYSKLMSYFSKVTIKISEGEIIAFCKKKGLFSNREDYISGNYDIKIANTEEASKIKYNRNPGEEILFSFDSDDSLSYAVYSSEPIPNEPPHRVLFYGHGSVFGWKGYDENSSGTWYYDGAEGTVSCNSVEEAIDGAFSK